MALLVMCCAILVGCSSADSSTAPPATRASAATAAPTITDGMIDIGERRQIRITCAGSSNPGPTVVLVSGSRSAGDVWQDGHDSVFDRVATFAPVCAYDRPGTLLMDGSRSPSTRVDQPTTAQQGVADLSAWLEASGLDGPFVLVGHSWGGMIAQLYAATYPSHTAGLVLVDPATVFLEDELTPGQWQQFLALSTSLVDGSRLEAPNYAESVDAVRASSVPPVPVTVVTADRAFDFGVGLEAWPSWLAAADKLAQTLDAQHLTQTASGHLIPIERPALVADAVRSVLDEAR